MAIRETVPKEIPALINFVIMLIACTTALVALYIFEHSGSVLVMVSMAILFSFVSNTIFSLFHESVHGVLFPNRKLNYYCGVFVGAFFPTSFTLQQIFHLGHHRRNRTDAEIFDQYYPGDNLFIKRFVLFYLLTGLYWTSPPMASLLYLFFPSVLNSSKIRGADSMKKGGFSDMLSGLDRKNIPSTKIRLEVLAIIIFQVSLFIFLDLSFFTWIVCYYSFAVNWSALQYADHAWSERDIRNGAWNLKINPIVEKIFLNYHFHLAHHQYPNVPWIHLPKLVDETRDRPSFWIIYFKLWRGPTEIKEPCPSISRDFEEEIYKNTTFKLASSTQSNEIVS
jgi:fatty acid desaturase